MIIVLKPDFSESQLQHICEKVQEMGFKYEISRGLKRTLVGVIGEEDRLRNAPLRAIPGVEDVMSILKPFKLASREFKAEDSVFDLGRGVKVGGGNLMLIAGPCAIEGEEILLEIGKAVRAAGANVLRGGAFKPRTSPYSFQGMGEEGLKILRRVGDELKMPVVTEVMDPRQVELVAKYTDIFQIGARNMQNFNLLAEVGKVKQPVLLKRGMSASVEDLLMSAEYILASGNPRVILCERGIRSFDKSTRNLLDLAIIPNAKGLTHLPIIADPSHATGRPDLIPAMSYASIAAGADGVHIEVHSCPEKAMSDGPQALLPPQYAEVVKKMHQLAEVMGKTIPQAV
ncbi:Phospho-2-dehydro-3-deoxyheptonate aldolase [Caulifigura coniformis]|uniref:Phospho-2-dehydro-3-deoxyheptonate aldolase n=1 Tax=Caulifigura coniformis TaxID=2527983 RepID=A0A517SG64_9PLAN|nr:3-deoxy-7-phosphoheptulonate synthase [Caulifigura coniformis]QDT55123.1 Phospho-2-dehydro-3-deoxyheptonate aldolase [Caulifigura coniformis]